jgi:predicted aspartyl protease
MRRWMIGLIMVCLLFPEAGLSDIYHWIDDQGIQNYTERFESVPEAYRSNVQVLSLPPVPPAPPELKPISPIKGSTRIPFSPGSPVLVNAKINGIGPISLILDTGSDRTIITPLVLSRLGLPTENAPPITLKGVTGMGYAERVWVNFIEIGEIRVGPLLVVVYATDLKGADGLLGRDFLSGLHVTIDSKEKIVTLTQNY